LEEGGERQTEGEGARPPREGDERVTGLVGLENLEDADAVGSQVRARGRQDGLDGDVAELLVGQRVVDNELGTGGVAREKIKRSRNQLKLKKSSERMLGGMSAELGCPTNHLRAVPRPGPPHGPGRRCGSRRCA